MIDERYVSAVTDKAATHIAGVLTEKRSESSDMPVYVVGTVSDTLKSVLTAVACVVLAAVIVIAFILMRNSISTPPADTTDDTETGAEAVTETIFLCTSIKSSNTNGLLSEQSYEYNANGTLIAMTDSDMMSEYHITCDEDGNIIKLVAVYFDEIKKEYLINNGKIYDYKMYSVADGSDITNPKLIYDEYGNVLREIYDENGTIYETVYSYTYSDTGLRKETKKIDAFGTEKEGTVEIYDSNGNLTELQLVRYGAVNAMQTGEYDDNGNMLSYKYFESVDGELVFTSENRLTYDEKGNCILIQYYNNMAEEGSRTVNEYDEYGNITRITEYVNGQILTDLSYTIEYDDTKKIAKMQQDYTQYDENGEVAFGSGSESVYTYNGFGSVIKKSVTSWNKTAEGELTNKYVVETEYTYQQFTLSKEQIEAIGALEDLIIKNLGDEINMNVTPEEIYY